MGQAHPQAFKNLFRREDRIYFRHCFNGITFHLCFLHVLDEVLKLKREWESADEEKKLFLEKRYGKKIIRQVVEESYSLQWLEEFSKQCPKCKTNIQVSSLIRHFHMVRGTIMVSHLQHEDFKRSKIESEQP